MCLAFSIPCLKNLFFAVKSNNESLSRLLSIISLETQGQGHCILGYINQRSILLQTVLLWQFCAYKFAYCAQHAYCSINPDIATSLISCISAGLKTCCAEVEVCQLGELWYKHWEALCGPKNGWRPQRLELQKQPHPNPTKDVTPEF